jgi:hypothetical protein
MLLQFLLLQHKPIKLFTKLLGARDHGDLSVFVFVCIYQFFIFFVPTEVWQSMLGFNTSPDYYKGYYHLFHQYNQSMPLWGPTCLGRMPSPNISFTDFIWKLFWS